MSALHKGLVPLVRKLGIEVLKALISNPLTFFIFRKFKVFQAVFVMYPANASYADHFTFRWRQRRIKWVPFVIGTFKHPSGARTLSFAISSDENEIRASSSPDELRGLNERALRIAEAIGARTIHYAGILPGRMSFLRVQRPPIEREATKSAVVLAVLALQKRLGFSRDSKVILLGSGGYVGKEVLASLLSQGVNVDGVDLADRLVIPEAPHIVLNITKPEAVNRYIDYFNECTVLLNEVYPAPHRDIVAQIKGRRARAFHLAGVKAKALPAFPASYKGAVPCCGAIPGEDYEIVFAEL